MTKLLERYQEELGSTFISDGRLYDLNALLILTEHLPVLDFPVSLLEWVLEWDTPDPERLKTADPSVPVLVANYRDELVTVDGLHRLTKAVELGLDIIPGIFVSDEMLAMVEIK
jgi:hypothetical protein